MFKRGRVEAGSYQFPISFVLPTKIPNSFNMTKSMKEYARIKYQVIGKFLGGNGGWFKGEFKLIDEEEIRVVKYYESVPAESHATQNSPFKCCCKERGRASFTADFEKKIYNPGEIANFTAKVDIKNLNYNVKDVQGQCTRTVTVKCCGYTRYWTTIVSKCSRGPLEVSANSGTYKMTPKIPLQYNSMSAFGRLVTSNYYLNVSCNMSCLYLCAQYPKLNFKILVCQSRSGYERMAKPKPTAYPPDWKPDYHEVKVIPLTLKSFNSYQTYTKGMDPPFQFISQNRGPQKKTKKKEEKNENQKDEKDEKKEMDRQTKTMLTPSQPTLPQPIFNKNETERPLKKIQPKILEKDVDHKKASTKIQMIDERKDGIKDSFNQILHQSDKPLDQAPKNPFDNMIETIPNSTSNNILFNDRQEEEEEEKELEAQSPKDKKPPSPQLKHSQKLRNPAHKTNSHDDASFFDNPQ